MRPIRILTIILMLVSICVGCTDDPSGGQSSIGYQDTFSYPPVNDDIEDASTEPDADVIEEPDTWYQDCVECQYYFCPPLNAIWQKQLCFDTCKNPPTLIYEGECTEYLECDPNDPIIDVNLPCITNDGYPGTQDKICNKGKIYYTDCETECKDEICNGEDDDCDGTIDEGFSEIKEICNGIDDNCNGKVDEDTEGTCENECGIGDLLCIAGEEVCFAPDPGEEICDGVDNDCDGDIDEGQLNVCGNCGPVPEEICDGVDNDCDGDIDEDLIQPCGTACGEGYEICQNGMWVSCTAPPVFPEICDGLDNDCDGSIDEELECICTIQDVGAFFPCQESPLLCGQGYKTCECTDPTCQMIVTTPCYAICHWLADPPGSDPNCDSLVGMTLSNEECNNFDDDCDQLIDEDLTQGCYTGPEGTLFVGICEPGEMVCEVGVWGNYTNPTANFTPGFCKDEVTPQPEVCNGQDDDCDGEVDWGEEIQDTDVLFVIDWSGSMSDEISAVMTALNQFAGNFSDETVLQWGVILGPKQSQSGWDEQLVLYHNLSGFSDFLNSMSSLGFVGMNTGDEMLLDALYLSLHNISGNLPHQISDLTWSSWAVVESIPPKDNFFVDWRPAADKTIIVFSDEPEQSYMSPQITPTNVITVAQATPQMKIYTFSTNLGWQWDEIAIATGGKYYDLTNNPTQMYNSLMEILDEICKSSSSN